MLVESILSCLAALRVFIRSRGDTALEILALRQQLTVLKRNHPRPKLERLDRIFWIALRRCWSRWTEALIIVKPETVVSWHRAGFRLYWRWRSRPSGGRPKITEQVRVLIRRLTEENPDWGAPKIHGELQKLGLVVSERTLARYLRRITAPRSWETVAGVSAESPRSDCGLRLLHGSDGQLSIALLLLRYRAHPS